MFGTVIVLTLLTDFDEWQLGDVSKFMRAIWHMLEHEYSKQSDSCHCMFNCCFSNRILRSEFLMYLLNWYWEKFVNLVKMSCSAAEIAEKRRLAKERLQKTLGTAHTPKPTTSSNIATSPGTDAKPTSVFYGNGNNEKAETLNQYENKMKHQPSHRTANRISSQPYPVRDGAAAQSTSSTNTNNNARKVVSIFEKVISCTCSMISSTRFQVKESGYSAKLIDVYKSIQTRSFGKCWNEKNRNFSSIHVLYFSDHEKKIWSFDLSVYDEVQKKVRALNPNVSIGPLPNFVLKLLRQGNFWLNERIEKFLRIWNISSSSFQKRGILISCVLKRSKRNSIQCYLISKNTGPLLQSEMVDDAWLPMTWDLVRFEMHFIQRINFAIKFVSC